MSVKLFLLNGPPGCGKDTLANAVSGSDRTFVKNSFAFPIKEANAAFYSLTDDQRDLFEKDRVLKESPHPLLLGKSWRQVNIDLAELFVKPNMGKDTFGKLLINRYKQAVNAGNKIQNIIISDCGFIEEINPLVEFFGKQNVHIIKILRPNCSYKGDSRNYVESEKAGYNTHYLRNDKKELDFLRLGWDMCQTLKNNKHHHSTAFSDDELQSTKNSVAKSTASKSKK